MAKAPKKGSKLDEWVIPTPRRAESKWQQDQVTVELRVRYEKGNRSGEDAKAEYVVSLASLGWEREFVGLTPQEVRVQVVAFLSRVADVTDVEDCLIVDACGFEVSYTRAQRGKLDGEDVHRVESGSRRDRSPEHDEEPDDAAEYATWKMGGLTPERKQESWHRNESIKTIVADTPANRAAITRANELVEHVRAQFALLFTEDRIQQTLSQTRLTLPMSTEGSPERKRRRGRRG